MPRKSSYERLAATFAVAVLAASCSRASASSQPPAKTARISMVQTYDGATGMKGRGVIDFGRDELSLVVDVPSGRVETRYFGPTLYFQVDGGRWATDNVTEGRPGSATMALLHGASEPGRGLDYLRRLDPNVHAVGTSTIRDTEVTQHRAVVDAFPMDGTRRSFGVDAWIDGQGRVLRLRLEDRQVLTYDFQDFGVAASIERPPVGTDAAR